ncbi:MAG: hypothetical protein PHU73_00090 [Patescibacteria group bacterium]|nr:hypothetical protein [Patescibacteria group bacterium]
MFVSAISLALFLDHRCYTMLSGDSYPWSSWWQVFPRELAKSATISVVCACFLTVLITKLLLKLDFFSQIENRIKLEQERQTVFLVMAVGVATFYCIYAIIMNSLGSTANAIHNMVLQSFVYIACLVLCLFFTFMINRT